MQWETLKGEAGGVQRFSSCQRISLKEQNAAFSFWGARDASQIFLPSYIFRTMVFVWGWWIIKVAQSCTYDGVCSLMCRFPSSVWFTCPRGAAGSLIVCTYFPKKTCLSLSAMLFFCFHVVGLHPNVQTRTCSLESRPNPQLIQSTTGLQADFLQTSRWYVQRADFINSLQYWRDVTWHYLNRLGQKQNWTKSGYRNM